MGDNNGGNAGQKRGSDGGNWGGNKKFRADTVTLRFLLNSRHAGGIIGKGGETIKRLRSEFSATVTVPDTNTNERVLSIGAERDNCIAVLKECLPLVHEPPYPVNTGGQGKESQYEVDFLVHSSQVGGIIGRGGFKIKELRENTKANIKVYQECLPDSTERVVAIGGSEDEVTQAVNEMLDVMQEQPIKGNITLYDPSYEHYKPEFEDNYYNNSFNSPAMPARGGMGGNQRGGAPRGGNMRGGGMRGGRGGGRGGGPPGGNFGGPQGGYGGGGDGGNYGGPMGGGQDFGGNSYGGGNSYSDNYNQGPPGGDGGYGSAPGGGNSFGGNSNFGGPNAAAGGDAASTTTQVTIPNDMAGAIIGKGGERIRGIRQKCGADIKFSDSDPGKKDRLITISGSQDQIQYAQYLMQQCVRQHATKKF